MNNKKVLITSLVFVVLVITGGLFLEMRKKEAIRHMEADVLAECRENIMFLDQCLYLADKTQPRGEEWGMMRAQGDTEVRLQARAIKDLRLMEADAYTKRALSDIASNIDYYNAELYYVFYKYGRGDNHIPEPEYHPSTGEMIVGFTNLSKLLENKYLLTRKMK